MVGAGAVVAQAFAAEGAKEDGSGVAQQGLPTARLGAADFQMLGRNLIR